MFVVLVFLLISFDFVTVCYNFFVCVVVLALILVNLTFVEDEEMLHCSVKKSILFCHSCDCEVMKHIY